MSLIPALNDVVAGNTYYYRVQALSGDQSSILSAEVTGTPRESITANALNDVAWNGTDTLVAVGDAGVILNSPNGMADAWVDNAVNPDTESNSLSAVTWDGSQFLIVGAGGTVLTGNDGITWDLQTTPVTTDLEDVAWLGNQFLSDKGIAYIAVGKNGIITSPDGIDWTLQTANLTIAGTTLNGVAGDGNIIVVVGTNGTILTSPDGITWTEDINGNNSLNDITWDGNQFGVVGSNDTILTSPDGITWTSHIPGTPNITFVAASQWDYSLPIDPALNPILGAVGSAGTFVVSPDAANRVQSPYRHQSATLRHNMG